MKVFVLFCVVLLAVAVVSAKKAKPTEEDKPKSLKKVVKECQRNEATKVDNAVLKKIKKHKPVDIPDNYGDHKLCILKGIGFINENGTVNEDNLKKRVTKKAEEGDDVNAIVTECKDPGKTAQETAIKIDTCLNKHSIDL
ncbi:uncharacterized protein LOC126742969 [Anthonomus grandis grandis]|uniref:Putative odorant-binding protein 9 n=1 Tax=Anthonomus grandis TaxID=7044 RepID=A0A2P9JZE9_ANTGR|nr:uncharacterized protein LOC126742969 [Anthonomus grandis grandis]AVI04890.1 putative odorant-binding protein 9 [Anthonomus grandis]